VPRSRGHISPSAQGERGGRGGWARGREVRTLAYVRADVACPCGRISPSAQGKQGGTRDREVRTLAYVRTDA
jgi:hypothetical protein